MYASNNPMEASRRRAVEVLVLWFRGHQWQTHAGPISLFSLPLSVLSHPFVSPPGWEVATAMGPKHSGEEGRGR